MKKRNCKQILYRLGACADARGYFDNDSPTRAWERVCKPEWAMWVLHRLLNMAERRELCITLCKKYGRHLMPWERVDIKNIAKGAVANTVMGYKVERGDLHDVFTTLYSCHLYRTSFGSFSRGVLCLAKRRYSARLLLNRYKKKYRR